MRGGLILITHGLIVNVVPISLCFPYVATKKTHVVQKSFCLKLNMCLDVQDDIKTLLTR